VLEEEKAHMPSGFELVFPLMVGEAKKMGLDLPYDSPLMEVVCDQMQKKLQSSGLAIQLFLSFKLTSSVQPIFRCNDGIPQTWHFHV